MQSVHSRGVGILGLSLNSVYHVITFIFGSNLVVKDSCLCKFMVRNGPISLCLQLIVWTPHTLEGRSPLSPLSVAPPYTHTHTHTHPKESLWMVLCVVSADDTVRAVPVQPRPSPWLACPQHLLLSSTLCLASSPHCSWRACSPGASDPLLALRPSCSSRHSQAGCLRGLCSDVTLSVSHPWMPGFTLYHPPLLPHCFQLASFYFSFHRVELTAI